MNPIIIEKYIDMIETLIRRYFITLIPLQALLKIYNGNPSTDI